MNAMQPFFPSPPSLMLDRLSAYASVMAFMCALLEAVVSFILDYKQLLIIFICAAKFILVVILAIPSPLSVSVTFLTNSSSSSSKRMSFWPAFPAVFPAFHALLLRHCCCVVYCLSACLCCLYVCVYVCLIVCVDLKTKSPSFPGHFAGICCAVYCFCFFLCCPLVLLP